MRKYFWSLAFGLMLVCLGFQAWAADYMKIRQATEAYEVMGQKEPASEQIMEAWLSGDKARMDTGNESSLIMRGDKQVIYILDHEKQVFSEMPMDMSKAMNEMIGQQAGSQEEAQMMAQMMGAMLKIKASVVDTGKTQTVSKWKCRVYEMTLEMPMGTTVSEICATEQIDVDMSMYRQLGNAMLVGQQGFEEMMQEMEKIKGISVRTTSTANIMGSTVKTTEELLEHKESSVPAEFFEVPANYKKQSFMGS